jgi:hypothetical protein
MPVTTFDPSDGTPSKEQQASEAAALQQGEALQNAQAEDRQRAFGQIEDENNALIGGKFRSQEDLLKAYKELESKLGKGSPEGEEEPTEEQPEATEEAPEEEVPESNETIDYMSELTKEYDQSGTISEEAMERLASMDSKELIKNYLQYYAQTSQVAQQQSLQAQQINDIKTSVGGDQAYTEMIQWAGANLPAEDIESFNQVTATNNAAAIKFAVESLNNRFRNQEGYEAPLVTGRGSGGDGIKPYRSQAELARDISNPMYHNDPAFRADVEARLNKSSDLL